MLQPILAYGHPLLREKGKPVSLDKEELDTFIDQMWQTMRRANGCGLAASQVGKNLCLFIVDSRSTYQQMENAARQALYENGDTGIEEVFINAEMISRSGDVWVEEEGCLSIPSLSQPVARPWSIEIRYLDKELVQRQKVFSGNTARMIQHEYDHTQGILYIDHLNPVARKLLMSRLKKIRAGKVQAGYPMCFFR
ncbi:peptide deformylase [Niabella ginsenosidivorans]|uniref:Peptide deformylase n=1 Tax=Niabella ginsenosidivorans TaxID=1176587 RepID=A0A1A9I3Z7_9BACT|nr:peptide deformylase [Niabella ginsenosidivorans]ANH82397.1 peptide deformylase [Niabella ginsenosidivorans]